MRTSLEKLRGLREDNDLTQTQTTDLLETSRSMYARYERGANEITIQHLITLCKFYSVSTDYFLDTQPSPRRPQRKAAKRG